MKIGFVVNDISTEKAAFTTTLLAMEASNRGHEVYMIGVGDFYLDPDDNVRAQTIASPMGKTFKNSSKYLSKIQAQEAVKRRISLEDLDLLILRNSPSQDKKSRPWAVKAGMDFGRLVANCGVIVLNDPVGLSHVSNRMYLQLLPEKIRPRSIVTRDRKEIRDFSREIGGNIVLKPLMGSRGEDVFLVTPDDLSNLNQIIETVSSGGYVVAQEQVSDETGDVRLFVMNGKPLKYEGKYAAFKRVKPKDDFRSTLPTGGIAKKVQVSSLHLQIAETVRPKLVEDGIFLAVLDIVGDKLIEIYTFSPGGLNHAQGFERVNFSRAIVEAMERKVRQFSHYGRLNGNLEMSTL
jgi:glutathione synthase